MSKKQWYIVDKDDKVVSGPHTDKSATVQWQKNGGLATNVKVKHETEVKK